MLPPSTDTCSRILVACENQRCSVQSLRFLPGDPALLLSSPAAAQPPRGYCLLRCRRMWYLAECRGKRDTTANDALWSSRPYSFSSVDGSHSHSTPAISLRSKLTLGGARPPPPPPTGWCSIPAAVRERCYSRLLSAASAPSALISVRLLFKERDGIWRWRQLRRRWRARTTPGHLPKFSSTLHDCAGSSRMLCPTSLKPQRVSSLSHRYPGGVSSASTRVPVNMLAGSRMRCRPERSFAASLRRR